MYKKKYSILFTTATDLWKLFDSQEEALNSGAYSLSGAVAIIEFERHIDIPVIMKNFKIVHCKITDDNIKEIEKFMGC